MPKGTDFNTVTIDELKRIENNLNNRPRKVLGFKIPNEIRKKEIIKIKKHADLISKITFNFLKRLKVILKLRAKYKKISKFEY